MSTARLAILRLANFRIATATAFWREARHLQDEYNLWDVTTEIHRANFFYFRATGTEPRKRQDEQLDLIASLQSANECRGFR